MSKVGYEKTMGKTLVAGEPNARSTNIAHCIVVICIYPETDSVEFVD